jgi:hypothetical protein
MNASVLKIVVVVFVLLLLTGFVVAGCKQKAKSSWVNTNSMPGQTFVKHDNNVPNSPAVVYLGDDKSKQNVNFGPQDMSFDFENLK